MFGRLFQAPRFILEPCFYLACFLFANANVVADNYRQLTLQYRNAIQLQSHLSQLVGESVSVVAESGNRLLLRGSAADLKSLVAMIRQLDKPRQQLRVWIYRGKNPSLNKQPYKNLSWSTDAGKKNRFDSAVIEEDTTLLVTESQLLPLPVERYIQNRRIAQYEERGWHSDKVGKALYDRKRYAEQTSILELTPSLLSGEKVSVLSRSSIPEPYNKENVSFMDVSLIRTLSLGEWVDLSNHQQYSYRPSLSDKRKVVSTSKKGEFNRSVWVKVERATD